MLRTKWHELPAGIKTQHVFAIGDIHGHARPLAEAFEAIHRTPDRDLPRHLVLLGDTLDRGPDNLGVAKLIAEAKSLARVDYVTYLAGNHEIMLAQALSDPQDHMMFWSISGGCEVINEIDPDETIIGDSNLAHALADALPECVLYHPERHPSHLQIDDVLFVHAGISPHIERERFLGQPFDEELPGACHWAWIRSPFLEWTKGWNSSRTLTITHGHSSVTEALFVDTQEIESACLLHQTHDRINLDTGAGYKISQIAVAEFLNGAVRVSAFYDKNHTPRHDPSE